MEETLMRIRLALTLALRDPVAGFQVQAARALERIEGVPPLQHLAVTADSPDTAGALRSLYAVADIGGENAFAILCHALQAPHAEVRATAVKLLARTKDPSVANHFIEALEDPNPDVKVLILEVLLPQLQQGSGPIREAAITALGNLGDLRAVDALLPLVTDLTPAVRERIAEALGRLGVRAAEEGKLKEITPPA